MPGSTGTQAQPKDPAGEKRAGRHTGSIIRVGTTQQRRHFRGLRTELELDVSGAGPWLAGRIWGHGAAGRMITGDRAGFTKRESGKGEGAAGRMITGHRVGFTKKESGKGEGARPGQRRRLCLALDVG